LFGVLFEENADITEWFVFNGVEENARCHDTGKARAARTVNPA
jgi:hypothetical protein